jgi:neutral amino acid transport system permease protein
VKRQLLGVIALGLAGFAALAFGMGTAHAQDGGEQIRVAVRNQVEQDGEATRQPVPDVSVTVTGADGSVVGEGVTDAEGLAVIPLPGEGFFTIELIVDTLPDGVALLPGAAGANPRTVNVSPGESQVINFTAGSDFRKVQGSWDILPQSLLNGLKLGLIIAMCAIGLSLIYGTTGLSNFTHGEMVTFGAIVAWWLNRGFLHLHLLIAAPLAVVIGGLAGGAFEKTVWKPLRRRKTSLTSMMIVSIGLAIFFRYLMLNRFGGRPEVYGEYAVQEAKQFWKLSLTQRDMVSIAICIVMVILVALLLLRTRVGKAMRAVSDNPDLASTSGINSDRIILIVWMIGGALAALGGILFGMDNQVKWDNGSQLLLLMFAAITLGGLGSAFGALVGSLIIGLMVELWAWTLEERLTSIFGFRTTLGELKTVGALAALIVILLIRPAGILGRKERVG